MISSTSLAGPAATDQTAHLPPPGRSLLYKILDRLVHQKRSCVKFEDHLFIGAPSYRILTRFAGTSRGRVYVKRNQPRTDSWNLPLLEVLGCLESTESALVVAAAFARRGARAHVERREISAGTVVGTHLAVPK